MKKCRSFSSISEPVYFYSLLPKGNICSKYYPKRNTWQKIIADSFNELLIKEQAQYAAAKICVMDYLIEKMVSVCQCHARFLGKDEATQQIRKLFVVFEPYIRRITDAVESGELTAGDCKEGWFIPYLVQPAENTIGSLYDYFARRDKKIKRRMKVFLYGLSKPIFRFLVYKIQINFWK